MNSDLPFFVSILKEKNLGLDDAYIEKIAKDLFCNLDERLKLNLNEWIEGQNISDIWIGKYCINAIMSIRGDNDFLGALEAMNTYLHNEEDGIRLIWRGRR